MPMKVQGDTRTALYQVGGLKGNHCRDRIEHTLSHLGGVASVKVDVGAGEVKVEYDPAVIPSGYIEETLQSLGYSIQG
jgi:copper chaperone CopZ